MSIKEALFAGNPYRYAQQIEAKEPELTKQQKYIYELFYYFASRHGRIFNKQHSKKQLTIMRDIIELKFNIAKQPLPDLEEDDTLIQFTGTASKEARGKFAYVYETQEDWNVTILRYPNKIDSVQHYLTLKKDIILYWAEVEWLLDKIDSTAFRHSLKATDSEPLRNRVRVYKATNDEITFFPLSTESSKWVRTRITKADYGWLVESWSGKSQLPEYFQIYS